MELAGAKSYAVGAKSYAVGAKSYAVGAKSYAVGGEQSDPRTAENASKPINL